MQSSGRSGEGPACRDRLRMVHFEAFIAKERAVHAGTIDGTLAEMARMGCLGSSWLRGSLRGRKAAQKPERWPVG